MTPYIYTGLSKTDRHRFVSFRTETSHETILRHVTSEFMVSEGDLKSKSRKREIVMPRHIAMHIIKDRTAMSLKAIGGVFNRDHSTVISAINTVNDLIETDKDFRDKFNKVNEQISRPRPSQD